MRFNGTLEDDIKNYLYCFVIKCIYKDIDSNTFAFPDTQGQLIIHKLRSLGLDLKIVKSSRGNLIFLFIRLPLGKLRQFSDTINFPMLLDPVRLEHAAHDGDSRHGIRGFIIRHEPKESPLQPYDYIYATYKYKPYDGLSEKLYWRKSGQEHPFRELLRLKLCLFLMESNPSNIENPVKLHQSILKKDILGFFPFQNIAARISLHKAMMRCQFPWQLPIEDIKEYFGELVGLLFAFKVHYVTWLFLPALLSIPIQLVVFITKDWSSPVLPFYAIFIVLWAIIMLEIWKRQEKFIALRWGMIGFEESDRDRADFVGEMTVSYIDGSSHLYFPSYMRRRIFCIHFTLVSILIGSVISAVAMIYILRFYDLINQAVASVISFLQIQLFNYLYTTIAGKLTNWENHRTDIQFEDSLISKLIVFQFINSYASFFYLAFFAEVVGDCSGDACLSSMATNVAIIFILRCTYKTEDGIADYAEVAIEFGYMVMFSVSLPFASLGGLISNLLQIRTDGWKLLRLYQRPIPRGAEDIGIWQSVFTIFSITGVITNGAIIVFSMTTFDKYRPKDRMWFFIGFILFCFLVQFVSSVLIPDEPRKVKIQLLRAHHLVSKVIDKVPDELPLEESTKYDDSNIEILGDIRVEIPSGSTDRLKANNSYPSLRNSTASQPRSMAGDNDPPGLISKSRMCIICQEQTKTDVITLKRCKHNVCEACLMGHLSAFAQTQRPKSIFTLANENTNDDVEYLLQQIDPQLLALSQSMTSLRPNLNLHRISCPLRSCPCLLCADDLRPLRGTTQIRHWKRIWYRDDDSVSDIGEVIKDDSMTVLLAEPTYVSRPPIRSDEPPVTPVRTPIGSTPKEPKRYSNPRTPRENICMICYKITDIYRLKACQHSICYSCLRPVLANVGETSKIKCPVSYCKEAIIDDYLQLVQITLE